jgi:hypothetical protein
MAWLTLCLESEINHCNTSNNSNCLVMQLEFNTPDYSVEKYMITME